MSDIVKIGPRVHHVRVALDDRDPSGDADDFMRLIEVALREDAARQLVDRLSEAFDCGSTFIRHWVTGVYAPAPSARRKAIAVIRTYYGLEA
ncbi:MAG TPA: hypothetical protein VJ694_05165 [Patescibacteria group bacterium]|nr:hypothetical protein [Patescibacteria group bacterium]